MSEPVWTVVGDGLTPFERARRMREFSDLLRDLDPAVLEDMCRSLEWQLHWSDLGDKDHD